MNSRSTRVTTKGQTTIPEVIRKYLGVGPGGEVEWHLVKAMAIVDKQRKIKNPTKFLVGQVRLDLDAVELVKRAREDFR